MNTELKVNRYFTIEMFPSSFLNTRHRTSFFVCNIVSFIHLKPIIGNLISEWSTNPKWKEIEHIGLFEAIKTELEIEFSVSSSRCSVIYEEKNWIGESKTGHSISIVAMVSCFSCLATINFTQFDIISETEQHCKINFALMLMMLFESNQQTR